MIIKTNYNTNEKRPFFEELEIGTVFFRSNGQVCIKINYEGETDYDSLRIAGAETDSFTCFEEIDVRDGERVTLAKVDSIEVLKAN